MLTDLSEVQVDGIGAVVRDPHHVLELQGPIGVDAGHVGVVRTLIKQDPSIVDGSISRAEEPHGAEVLALVVGSTDRGEGGESVSVVFSHESSILQIGSD